MELPSVAALSARLGEHLRPAEGFELPDRAITAVHVSELNDPTPYLSGGELLLTTGLALPTNTIGCERYVSSLRGADVVALALGLGPVHASPPEQLLAACRSQGLPLLLVPAPTPFLMITRTYWESCSRSTEHELNENLAAHRSLVDAAVSADPMASVLKRLSRALGGWTAWLTPSGEVEHIFPLAMAEHAESISDEVGRLQVAGAHSAASFSTGGTYVAIFPIATENRVAGYLGVGTVTKLDSAGSRLVLTASSLLSLEGLRTRRGEHSLEIARRCVALLADEGMIEAARRLALRTDVTAPARRIRALAVRSTEDLKTVALAVRDVCRSATFVPLGREVAWALVDDEDPGLAFLPAAVRAVDPSASVVVSTAANPESLNGLRLRAVEDLARLGPGELVSPDEAVPGAKAVTQQLDRLISQEDPALLVALVAYLRHRGQWEQAARELSVHRNTLRYRINRIADRLGLDLDDPDVASHLWLALRSRDLA